MSDIKNSDAPPVSSPAAPIDARFDEILSKLQGTVEKLEGGQLSLEQSLAAFEEGARLARRGQEILDAAEKRVEILMRGAGGEMTPQTLEMPDE